MQKDMLLCPSFWIMRNINIKHEVMLLNKLVIIGAGGLAGEVAWLVQEINDIKQGRYCW